MITKEPNKHRSYIGNMWERIGQLQFDFLITQGLEKPHVLYDIACGSLRAGIHIIPYLNQGNYCGIEKHDWLISAGTLLELPQKVYSQQKPELVISDKFEFEKFSKSPDFCIAQSLFTHLPVSEIKDCLEKLRAVAKPTTVLFATFFETSTEVKNPNVQSDAQGWRYTLNQMQLFGKHTGWLLEYIGNWGHPKGQKMLKYTPV
ncbi:MAG: hypothetical protein COA78_21640 [Blastopirellula sp.]|nr:MAG: hypothetical protein COA78_21640 [Blastopirellula sp.]